MKLSIIIPLYNAERYIANCLDSVLGMGLAPDEYEILIINDGSTDRGPDIASKYMAAHQEIKLISQPNSGVAAARNKGLECARGGYIHFIDADDELICGTLYKKLLSFLYLKGSCVDVLTFWSITIDNWTKRPNDDETDFQILSEGQLMTSFGNQFLFSSFVWNNFYKRQFLLQHQLRFKSYKIGEDTLFNLEVSRYNPYICRTDARIYLYYLRKDSAVNNLNKNYLMNVVKGFADLLSLVSEYAEKDISMQSVYDTVIAAWQRQLLTRQLSSECSLHAMKGIFNDIKQKAIRWNTSTMMNRIIVLLIHQPILVWILSPLYRHVFLLWIKPYLKRN